jgi:hypothetical protein
MVGKRLTQLLDIFPLMFAADKVWITVLTLIHKNVRSVRNSYVQELTLILKIIGQCDVTCRTCCNTSDNVCLDLQNCHYSIYNQPIINLFTISYPKEGQVHWVDCYQSQL